MAEISHPEIYRIKSKITNKKLNIGIIGLGYVGLPLAIGFSKAGFNVTGIDINKEKVMSLNAGHSYILDIEDNIIIDITRNENFKATTDFKVINFLDAIIVCVPTPLNKNQEPDISHLDNVSNQILENMKEALFISVESTTYPGCTREIFNYKFQQHHKIVNKDYFLCFSPERIDPGNMVFQTRNIPKVIGGITSESSEIGKQLYKTILEEVVLVSSTEIAEMSKLLENTFRSVNIAFINEMALMCDRMDIDIWEVIDAAATKPFGYLPFYPSCGVGGHCIPLDPMYLHWKGKQNKFFNQFIEMSQNINLNMPYHVVDKIQYALNTQEKCLNKAEILLVGITYKPDIDDLRESPALEVYDILKSHNASLSVLDPLVDSFYDKNHSKVSVIQDNYCNFGRYDCVVILTKHKSINYGTLEKNSHLIVDMCHTYSFESEKIHTFGRLHKKESGDVEIQPSYDIGVAK